MSTEMLTYRLCCYDGIYQASQFRPCGILCKLLDKYGNEVNDVGSQAIMTVCTSLKHGDASFRELISIPLMLLYDIFPAYKSPRSW